MTVSVARYGALLLAVLLATAPAPARAQSDESATERLLQILVKNGVVTKDQAESLGKQARAEARATKATAPASMPPAAGGTNLKEKPVAPGAVRVTYVPETVRKQIAAEVKQQVMQQATEEGWAEPNSIAGWTQRIRISGDVRMRGQFDMFPGGNYNAFPDFNTINSSTNGYDTTSGINPPLLNTTENRTRARLRARLEVDAQVTDWADAVVRIATGNDRSPAGFNQTLGNTGDFSKYAIWLDQAAMILRPAESLTLYAGRFANPFWTTNLVYDDDLSFDGVAFNAHAPVTQDFGGFLIAGGFPVYNTDFNYGATNLVKTSSHDSYLLAAQTGVDWKPNESPYSARLAVGYFNYQNTDGQTSSLCVAPTSFGSCNTDNTRAPYVQFGNTLFPVRNIYAANGVTTAQPQFYGLASRFGVLDVHGQLVYKGFHPIDILPEFQYINNLSFNQNVISQHEPVNNIGANNAFVGSGTGYLMRIVIGHSILEAANDWNVGFTYKYIGSDAALDALEDSKFHLGGTNAKGWVVNGNYALGKNIWVSGNYYSTTAVSGPPYAVDTVQLDLNVKF